MKNKISIIVTLAILLFSCSVPASERGVEIVIPAEAPKTVLFAAKELKGFLEESLDIQVPISNTSTDAKTSFMLGGELWQKAGFSAPFSCWWPR